MSRASLPAAPAFVQGLVAPFELPDAADPEGGEVQHITIGPANMGQLARLMGHSGDLLDVVTALQPERAQRLANGQPTIQDLDVLLTLLQDKGELALDLVSIAAGIERDLVEALAPDRFAWLFGLVVMVNADFFSRSRGAFAAAGALFARARQLAQTGPASSAP